MKKKVALTLIIAALLAACVTNTNEVSVKSTKNAVVFSDPGSFAGWPANNGVWTWNDGKEILVGFTKGPFVEVAGHNIAKTDRKNLLARSTDGGMTWATEEPANFAGKSAAAVLSPGGINFEAPGFAMKVMADGYHGHTDKVGSFFVSDDKGKIWKGPYRFNGLMQDPNLAGTHCTSRTGYLVTGPKSCLIFMSARPIDKKVANAPQFIDSWDKSYVAETTDGGKSFHFVSWIAPISGQFRAVMPAVCRLKDGSIVATVRANRVERDENGVAYMAGHVDAYGSADNGKTWSFLSRVGETGGPMQNGNPPALVALKDGRIACAYGDRRTAKIKARTSSDGGKTWGDELVVRDDFQRGKDNSSDMGYPRLVTNHKNNLVAMYYWATKENPQGHIAATIWEASPPIEVRGDETNHLNMQLPDGGLKPVVGVQKIQIMHVNPNRPELADGEVWTYAHHQDLAVWKGRLYTAWVIPPKDEDAEPWKVVYAASEDGFHWSAHADLFPRGVR